MERKSCSAVELKADGDKGEMTAVFATFDVVDHDGDVVLKDAITDGTPVRISAFNHASWGGALPVGKGVVKTTSTEAIVEAQFFNTQAARDTFATIKEMGDLQEYSWGFDIVKHSFDEREGKPVRVLESVKLHEVSPVLLGASIGTRTLAVKSGMQFSEHITAVMADVSELITRAGEVLAIRRDKGKDMSEVSHDLLELLDADLRKLHELLAPANPPVDYSDEVASEYARFIASQL